MTHLFFTLTPDDFSAIYRPLSKTFGIFVALVAPTQMTGRLLITTKGDAPRRRRFLARSGDRLPKLVDLAKVYVALSLYLLLTLNARQSTASESVK